MTGSSKTSSALPIALAAVIAAIVFGVGGYYIGVSRSPGPAEQPAQQAEDTPKNVIYTCPMHAQVRQNIPGKCPSCGMALVRLKSGGDDDLGPAQLRMSKRARKLAEIQTSPVERKFVSSRIRLVGKVTLDETRVANISAYVPGRLDRLYVDYTGIPVKKGDHLVYLYSPELLTAQQELLEALRAVEEVRDSTSERIKAGTQANVEAIRGKLLLWGLTPEQVDGIEKRGKPSDHMTIYSPIGGIVIRKYAVEGMYVKTGTRIYTVADLSKVWVKLDAYETDLKWLRYGQAVEFSTEAYPGETFKGLISFIDPMLNAKTRTVKIRVNVPNADGRLKPEMFVRAIVRANIAKGGRVIDAALAGKWICPMHPEVVKDELGECDLCGMPLVRAETLGFVTADPEGDEAPLVIPATAPLLTGKRAVVYVAVPDKEGVFEGRVITLGPRAGDWYIVNDGLKEGELVVTKGAFKIDSSLQILAKRSMMLPGDEEPVIDVTKLDVPDEFKAQIDPLLEAYFAVGNALSHDKLADAQAGARAFEKALAGVDMMLLKGKAHDFWMTELKAFKTISAKIAAAETIEKARASFEPLSGTLAVVVRRFGTGGKHPVMIFHCPMAFNNRGADWLQTIPATENPYFGSAMFACGEQTEVLVPGPEPVEPEGDK